MTEHHIDLPWSKPPLSLNYRMNRWDHARTVKEVREAGAWLAKQHKLGSHERVRVSLHIQPRDRRVRDDENPVPTLKALCDGLVDAGLTAGDTAKHMVKDMPVIHEPVKGETAAMWLVITVLDETKEAS